MIDRAFEITSELILGKQVSDEDKLWLQKRNAKYNLVRYLYIEKKKSDGIDLKDFQFTPGKDFADTPTIDILIELLKFDEAIKQNPPAKLDFGDFNLESIELED